MKGQALTLVNFNFLYFSNTEKFKTNWVFSGTFPLLDNLTLHEHSRFIPVRPIVRRNLLHEEMNESQTTSSSAAATAANNQNNTAIGE